MFARGFHARRWHCPRACGEVHLVPNVGVSRDPEVFEIAHPVRAAIRSSRTSLPLRKAVVLSLTQQAATAPIASPRSRRASWPFAGLGSLVNITANVIRQKHAGANLKLPRTSEASLKSAPHLSLGRHKA